MAQGLTRALATFVATLQLDQLPASARPTVRRGMADCIGVLFAGRDEPVVGHALSMIQAAAEPSRAQPCVLLGGRGYAGAPDAALVNAVAAHALDYDDTGLDGHPSVVLAPAVLAEAASHAERGASNWGDVITAYVAGYETWAELSGRDADRHHGKGWHPTAVFGAVACAAASARLRRLDTTHTAHALGLAASMAAGLVANFGSMTKPLQVGLAARHGLVAARLAERGVTAAPDALESPRGFLAAISPRGEVDLTRPCAAGPDRVWQIERQGLNIKRYPVCYALHRAVDAALTLHASLVSQRATTITRVDVSLGRLQAAMLRSSRPTTGLDAKFSAEYAIACGLTHGRLGLGDLTDEAVNRADLQALLRRVHVSADDATDPDEPLFSPADTLRVTLDDGRIMQAEPVRRALGHATRPIDDAALLSKFIDCGGPSSWWDALMKGDDDAPMQLPA